MLVLLIPEAAAATTTTRIIIKREPGLKAAERADIRADAGVRLVRTLSLPRTEVVTTTDPRDALATLRRDGDVVYAELDRIRTAQATDPDPLMGDQWALFGPAGAGIDAVDAWYTATGVGQKVGVVDTGVDVSHPDFQVEDGEPPKFSPDSFSFVAPRGSDVSDLDDSLGHGTHVAGTIAAVQGNGEGISGVAPEAAIVSLRALTSEGSGRDSDIAESFRYAGTHHIPIVNASVAGPGASQTLRDAIKASPNTLFVVSAGNDDHNNDVEPIYPCNTPEPNVLCVGASTESDTVASFSNVGPRSVDLFAPGVGILSTVPTALSSPDLYLPKDGTSMAAPHVAATAALVLQAAPTALTTKALKEVLLASAHVPVTREFDASVSDGRLDAAAAVLMAHDGTLPTDDTDVDGWVDAADACPNGPATDTYDGCVSDHDWDGISDDVDNCDLDPHTDQTDLDADGRGAPCDSTPRGHNNDGDHLWQIDDACPNVYGTLANGCPAPAPAPTPSPPANRDNDARVDSVDYCPTEYALTNDGCPLPQIASLSGKVRKRGTRRSVTVTVVTTRLSMLRVTIERKRSGRWIRVKSSTVGTVANRASVAARRISPGRYRVRVSIYNGAGNGTPVTQRFRVR
jgi:subtilisin family serine protease